MGIDKCSRSYRFRYLCTNVVPIAQQWTTIVMICRGIVSSPHEFLFSEQKVKIKSLIEKLSEMCIHLRVHFWHVDKS
jgi:hypothetical protein